MSHAVFVFAKSGNPTLVPVLLGVTDALEKPKNRGNIPLTLKGAHRNMYRQCRRILGSPKPLCHHRCQVEHPFAPGHKCMMWRLEGG